MRLPFSKQAFFELFAAYNGALWPAVVALWLLSVLTAVWLLSPRRSHDRWISGLLTVHWAWSAVAYHVVFFTRINPAAWLFGAMFLLQAALFLWSGVIRGHLSFRPSRTVWTPIGLFLVAYALLYPAINAAEHGSVLRIPTFGLPCPTTIFTAGLLMLAAPHSRTLAIVPIIWSVIGGSAAFLLGVSADYALPIAGAALAVLELQKSLMSSANAVPPLHRRKARSVMVRKTLLACGILSSLSYAAMTVVIAMQWEGYSSASQVVSELSAIGAPTRSMWLLPAAIYTVLVIAFGWGVWQSAGRIRSLRIVGGLIIAYGSLGLFWPLAPMHLRETLAAGGSTLSDTMHLVLGGVTVLLMLLAIGVGAAAFGKRFRVYSIVSIVILAACGFLTFLDAPSLGANLPTPWIGVWERLNIGVFLLWVVVLATALLRARDNAAVSGLRDPLAA